MKDLNQEYFNLLLSSFKNTDDQKQTIVLHEPEKKKHSNIICIPIANDEDLKSINIQRYEDLSNNYSKELENFTFTIIKMQAGLGSSVKRFDLIKEVEGREHLGAKGTDLYFEIDGSLKSIAEIQLLQAKKLSTQNIFKKIKYQNLVNDETKEAVLSTQKLITESDKFSIGDTYLQKKMPTVGEDSELTTERMAPAGHGFIGIAQIIDTFLGEEKDEIVAIGNGEDLSSSPDVKIINWVIENDLPAVMITTTKTKADKKGGQISIVKGDIDHVTIVEKAQAQASGQLEYFEQLGLRDIDSESLFNTNIVVINKKSLKNLFNKFISTMPTAEFLKSFAPDVIKNTKEQDGKKFIQLESALGSVLLNLDKFFRLNYKTPVVSFLNLSPNDRKTFFMPIKKREDYDEIKQNYSVDPESFCLKKK